MAGDFSQKNLDGFRDATQSLKLYRRAELGDAGSGSLIESLYVDPLPNDHVLNTMLKPNTTFVVGRKGTGKSTIFQRAQHELRKRTDVTSAYIDIKTVYEASQVDPAMVSQLAQLNGSLPPGALERLLLHKAFLSSIIGSIRDELKRRIEPTFWRKVRRALGGTLEELFEGLDEILSDADRTRFENVLGAYLRTGLASRSLEQGGASGASANFSIPAQPSVAIGVEATRSYTETTADEAEYADVLMRTFDVKKFILQLKTLLDRFKIRHLYIFVDDFSELPLEAMKVVVDALLGPLNNWSDELVKFKIAAYPGRIYYGQVDKSKIDEVNLDLFSLYGTGDIVAMEEKAVDFTRRLIQRRIEHYAPDVQAANFFAPKREDDLWRQLFYATMANPRNLGYLLFFAYETSLIYGREISARDVRIAARRYYEEKLNAYFEMNRFLQESFDERSSIFSLKELLDKLIERSKALRGSPSSVIRDQQGRAPTSHFHIPLEFEPLLATLELNFFVTKYYVMTDRDGRKVAVYALNYGLCQQNNIEFGRPVGSREQRYRQYYAERIFDYSPILRDYLASNQEIVCASCDVRHDYSDLEMLRRYGMLCPACRTGTCNVINLSRKYEDTLRSVSENLLLPRVELGILHTLNSEGRPLFAQEVAGDLDCSYQLVGKRAKALSERGLVHRGENEQGRRQYTPTPLAKRVYLAGLDESAEDAIEI
ncbi:hypothetical protein [Micromonospora violae]|uniref:hypothetical protein n=1 Tax=Micromonospora violae TaxID=1278207 RepID=UPI0033F1897B